MLNFAEYLSRNNQNSSEGSHILALSSVKKNLASAEAGDPEIRTLITIILTTARRLKTKTNF